jgi:2-keto-4-pentenoate hydratase
VGAGCLAVEPEVWIELARDIDADAGPDGLAESIGAVGLAAEVVDMSGRFDDLASVLEGNIFHRLVVFAARTSTLAWREIPGVQVEARRNGAIAWSLPVGAFVPDIRAAVAFAAAALAARGERLRAGQRVISGLLTPLPVWAQAGDAVVLSAGGLGHLALDFHEGDAQ